MGWKRSSVVLIVSLIILLVAAPQVLANSIPIDIDPEDAELVAAYTWAEENDIFHGYPDGTFHPREPVLKRHVALVAQRAGSSYPLWEHDYGLVTRAQVRDEIPALLWKEHRWEQSLTRGQLLRLMYRDSLSSMQKTLIAGKLEQLFSEKHITWRGVTRSPRLMGTGLLIVQQAREHCVPIWLALGQAWRESQWGTTGLSTKYNCIWGVKDGLGKYGTITKSVAGFSSYVTVEENIKAYFRLMDSATYRTLIDSQNWSRLLNIYAPAFENNTRQHYNIVMTVRNWCLERGIY